jgi:hypothetical protein
MVLLSPNPCVSPVPVFTVAVDAGTGRTVWQREGVVMRRVPGSGLALLVRSDPPYGCGGDAGVQATSHWEGVDTASGRLAWTFDTARSVQVLFRHEGAQDASQAVFVAPDGTLTSRSLRTGRSTGEIRLPELGGPQPTSDDARANAERSDVTIVEDHVLVVRRRLDPTEEARGVLDVTAYRTDTLRQAWSNRSATADRQVGTDYYDAFGCGPVICQFSASGTTFFDPRDGQERWRTRLQPLTFDGARGVFGDSRAVNRSDPLGILSVRDLRTGRPLAQLSGWRAIGDGANAAPVPVLGYTVRGRTSLARIDIATGRVIGLGSAPGWYGACLVTEPYIACRRIDGGVRAWRMPR